MNILIIEDQKIEVGDFFWSRASNFFDQCVDIKDGMVVGKRHSVAIKGHEQLPNYKPFKVILPEGLTEEDSDAFLNEKEGWNVFDCKGSHNGDIQICRLDEVAYFTDDLQAIMYVVTKALTGSERHRRALNQIKAHADQREYENIRNLTSMNVGVKPEDFDFMVLNREPGIYPVNL